MKIYRFMSAEEADTFLSGRMLHNSTDHHARRGNASTAAGFCFGIGNEHQALKDYRRLSGIVSPDWCIVGTPTADFRRRLRKCRGRYINYDEFDKLSPRQQMLVPLGAEPLRFCDELCTFDYCLQDFAECKAYTFEQLNSI